MPFTKHQQNNINEFKFSKWMLSRPMNKRSECALLNNCHSAIVKEKVHLNALDPFLMEVENNINEFEKIQVTCIE